MCVRAFVPVSVYMCVCASSPYLRLLIHLSLTAPLPEAATVAQKRALGARAPRSAFKVKHRVHLCLDGDVSCRTKQLAVPCRSVAVIVLGTAAKSWEYLRALDAHCRQFPVT